MRSFVIALVGFLFITTGCASKTHVKMKALEDNKEFLFDGKMALSSEKKLSRVIIRFTNDFAKDGEKAYLWILLINSSEKDTTFIPSKHIKITRNSDNESAKILEYNDLLKKQLNVEGTLYSLIALSDFLDAALTAGRNNRYQDLAGRINTRANFNTHLLMDQRGKEKRKFIHQSFIKPTTIFANSRLSGLVTIQSPKLPDRKWHTYSVEITFGEEIHKFSYTQARVKRKSRRRIRKKWGR